MVDRPDYGSPEFLWDSSWGTDMYCSEDFVGYLYDKLIDELPMVLVDVGAAMFPVTRMVRDSHRIIEVDRASDEADVHGNVLRVRFDIEALFKDEVATAIAVTKIATFLGIDASSDDECDSEQVDAFVFSQILNYVDYRRVISAIKKYLKPGGKMYIYEIAQDGLERAFSADGIKSHYDLLQFVRDEGLNIEESHCPDKGRFLLVVSKPLK